ncbi:MAG: hypothetical protein KDD55_08775 [Bdellovibrionales bacterium]|nr:hypothetical protein [Bdellovibrionales bacterium]
MTRSDRSKVQLPDDWPTELPSKLYEEELALRESASIEFAKTRIIARLQSKRHEETPWQRLITVPKLSSLVAASVLVVALIFSHSHRGTPAQEEQAEVYLESVLEYHDLQGADLFDPEIFFLQGVL